MGNYGIKIAKAGKSIASTDRKDYVFWSKYHTRTIVLSDTATHTANDNTTTHLIYYHNLGYLPQLAMYTVNYDGYFFKLPYSIWDTSSGYLDEMDWIELYTDRVDIKVLRYSTGSNYTFTVRFIFFMEAMK